MTPPPATCLRLRLWGAVAALFACALAASFMDVSRAGGGIKGDEATYVGLAASAGIDGDLRFTAPDYQRFVRWYGSGPEGVFLKRGAGDRLYFGKAYLYGIVAAPFARLAGLGGLFFFNLACLVLVAWAGAVWLGAESDCRASLAFVAAFVLASVAPLYAFWLTSETLNFALVFVAFALVASSPGAPVRSRGSVVLGSLCLAAAIFSKPLNLPLALPLALAAARGLNRRALQTLTIVGAIVIGLFAMNAVFTGELNYQGGERKTFYGAFPYDDAGHTFDTAGIGMTTNTVQTPVGGEGRLAPLAANTWYFLAGRHFGLLPFGWPWLVALGLWSFGERRKAPWQWALVGALALTALVTMIWMPYTWSGGGGPVGNRYFLSLGAASFFLMPRIRSLLPAAAAALGLVFVGPSLAEPFTVAKQPWRATESAAFQVLPLELTGASDFPVILDARRGRIPQGRRPTVFVALLDSDGGLGKGGWMSVAPHASASLLVRSPEPLENVTVGLKSPGACRIALSSDISTEVVSLGAGDRRDALIAPAQTFSRDSYVFVLDLDASGCETAIEVALQGHAAEDRSDF